MTGRVLVTGASSGIGAATARLLAAHGWRVLAAGRDARRLAAVAADGHGRVEPIVAELTDGDAVARLAAVAASVPLHAVVHAAGVVALGPVATAPVADLERQWRVNVWAPYLLTQALLEALRSQRGHVVFVNSGSGYRANANWSAYAATKFALRALADALRAEESQRGVRVTSVYPGRTDTPMQQRVFEAEGRAYAPAGLVPPSAVADSVRLALETPPPGLISDIEVRPG